jgi:putative ABC transport system permease protein
MRDWKTVVRAHIEPLPLDPARAADIVDEVAQHVAQHHADLVASGMSDEEALTIALTPLSDREHVRAEIARADRPRPKGAPAPPPSYGGGVVADLIQDTRYALRLLRRSPAFAAAAIVTLALGIGADTAIFSVLNAVLLRPLPYADPSRLVMIGELGTAGAGNVGFTTFLDWRDRSHGFEDMALIRSWSATLVAGGEPERVAGMRVSSNYFRLLGIHPAIGRDFTPEEDTQAGWRVLVLSDRLWRRRFAADPTVVGRPVMMSGAQFTVIGVLPASFEPLLSEHFYQRADIWALVGYDTSLSYACRSCQHLKAIGRLKAGVSIDTARRDIDAVHAQLRLQHPTEYAHTTMTLVPLTDELTGNIKPVLFVLMGAVAFVLLIACANVASLLLARTARRQHDLALRTALGASRGRIVRQLLVENAILACAGGAAGLVLSAWAVPLLSTIAPITMARLDSAHVDPRVVAFSVAASLATALVFGLVPSLRASRIDLQSTLHGDSRRTSRNPTSAARRLLVAADVMLAVVLLAGAGLMIRSVGRLLGVDPGFNADRVLSMQVSFVGQAYATNEQVVTKTDQMLTKLRTLPGVERVATASQIPLGGNGDCWGFHIQGRPAATPADDPCPERYGVTPDYFSVMQIPLRAGRLFSDADVATSEQVLVIGERTATTLWPHGDALGQHVRIGDAATGPWRTIIGVVGDVRHRELAVQPTMQMYTPQTQFTDSFLTVVIRGGGDPSLLANEARRAIWSVASDVPVYEVAPVADLVAKSVGPRRFVMVLLELFGAIALLMTAVGLYGVISYSVVERTREIGIRSALGASRADIARLVLGSGFAVVATGLAAGVVAALAATRFLEGSLYGVRPGDPAMLAVVVAVLFVVAGIAQAVPAARALRVDPSVALRAD